MINPLKIIKTKIANWKENRFLKKHGCENWDQYNYRYDPDIVANASTVGHYFTGYEYVYCFQQHHHPVYYWDLGHDGIYQLNQWAKQHLKNKFRIDFLRVYNQGPIAESQITPLGGHVYIFFACKSESDYMLFLLKWS